MTLPTFIESPRFTISKIWQVDIDELFSTVIIRRASGRERSYLPSEYYTGQFVVTIPEDALSDMFAVRRYYLAVRAKTIRFRLQNPLDYLSCDIGDALFAKAAVPSVTALDQPLIVSGSLWQLVKNYSIGSVGGGDLLQYQKPIFKPFGTIIVANDSGVTQDPSNYTIDTTTGLLTKLGGFSGIPTTWGGQFDTPCRFDSSINIRYQYGRADPLQFTLVEVPL